MSDKPTIFIASSSEATPVAEAVNIKLDQEMRVKLWTNAFDLSSVTITTLIKKANEVDYAIFVFHPDDKLLIREKEHNATRDNVILELGIFIGKLGLEKCFILLPNSPEKVFRLPSDLAGVTATFYNAEEIDLVDAVTVCCAKIKQQVRTLEIDKKKTDSISEVDILKQQINKSQSQVWNMGHEIQSAREQSQSLLESIKHLFYSIAKPATPMEIKNWEDGASTTYLKEIKIPKNNVYFVDKDVIIPSFFGVNAISIIVGKGVNIYGYDKLSHNRIYYMDGFRSISR